MERLTDRKTAADLKTNAEKLRTAGLEPSEMDKRYIKLAEYENADKKTRHGYWIVIDFEQLNGDDSPTEWECDNCSYETKNIVDYNYCPKCGAKMYGEMW